MWNIGEMVKIERLEIWWFMSCDVWINKTEMGEHNLFVDFLTFLACFFVNQFIIYLPMNESVASLAV